MFNKKRKREEMDFVYFALTHAEMRIAEAEKRISDLEEVVMKQIETMERMSSYNKKLTDTVVELTNRVLK